MWAENNKLHSTNFDKPEENLEDALHFPIAFDNVTKRHQVFVRSETEPVCEEQLNNVLDNESSVYDPH